MTIERFIQDALLTTNIIVSRYVTDWKLHHLPSTRTFRVNIDNIISLPLLLYIPRMSISNKQTMKNVKNKQQLKYYQLQLVCHPFPKTHLLHFAFFSTIDTYYLPSVGELPPTTHPHNNYSQTKPTLAKYAQITTHAKPICQIKTAQTYNKNNQICSCETHTT